MKGLIRLLRKLPPMLALLSPGLASHRAMHVVWVPIRQPSAVGATRRRMTSR